MSPELVPFLPGDDCRLPATFYGERHYLTHIRHAAHSRGRSPDAVLLATAARVVALIDYRWVLPGIVGTIGSLNFLGGIVASPGGGKTGAAGLAAELAPFDDPSRAFPLGSGEGIAAAFVSGDKADPPRYALFTVDEGAMIHELGGRKGATLMPTIRLAAHGQQLGQKNGNKETTRIVEAHGYRVGLLAGFQPVNAGPFICDDAEGTPQRFVWATTHDPTMPEPGNRPDWPGPLAGWCARQPDGPRHPLTVSEAVANEIRWNDHERTTGQTSGAPLDAHHDLERLRLAGVLALWDGRTDITDDDFRLASAWSAASANLRNYIARWYEKSKAAQDHKKATHDGELRATNDEAKAAANVRRLAERMTRVARDKAAAGERWGPTASWAGRDSHLRDDAERLAVRNRWVVFEGRRCLPGPNADEVND